MQVAAPKVTPKSSCHEGLSKQRRQIKAESKKCYGHKCIETSGSPGTELGTGNRTVLEPEPAEPAIENEPDEPEPRFGSISFFFIFYLKQNAKCLRRLMRNV